MIYIIIGSFSFILFFLYDFNSVTWKNPVIHRFFLMGSVILLTATLIMLVQFRESLWKGIVNNPIWLVFSIGFSTLLIYTLFFALPFDDTYGHLSDNRKTYTKGVYSLCRHPGVLWFVGMYFSFYLLTKEPLILVISIIWSFWNILYVVFQDLWIFPKTFVDYHNYQSTTPFLIPSLSKLRRFKDQT